MFPLPMRQKLTETNKKVTKSRNRFNEKFGIVQILYHELGQYSAFEVKTENRPESEKSSRSTIYPIYLRSIEGTVNMSIKDLR